MSFSTTDHEHMSLAIETARRARNITTPNPAVGCVIVVDDKVAAIAHTMPAGDLHAEAQALLKTDRDVMGGTAYVTLEPCCHHGKTPPCTEAIIAAGIKRVVIAQLDPNPLVAGKGVAALQVAGITVEQGLLADEAAQVNAGFLKRMQTGLPKVTIKAAMSMDGRTAMASGESKWITGASARQDVQQLRARSCAIMTGIETVLADDPSMTVRLSASELGQEGFVVRQPWRVILDTNMRTPANAKIIGEDSRSIIFHADSSGDKSALESSGANCVIVDTDSGSIDLKSVLAQLAEREINEVLVEAGATLTAALIKERLVDEIVLYIAPKLMGSKARPLFDLSTIAIMDDAIQLEFISFTQIGDDLKIRAIPKY